LPKLALRKPPIPGRCARGVLGRLADQPRERDQRDAADRMNSGDVARWKASRRRR
jgi:hypothetical protein